MMRLRLGYPETNAELEMLDTAMKNILSNCFVQPSTRES